MGKEDLKYIEHIEIKGLWGRYDVDWKLNSDVNILVGENGTGKSTILDIVFRATKVSGKIAANGKVTNKQSVNEKFNKFMYFKVKTNYNTEINGQFSTDDSDGEIITTRDGIEPLVSILKLVRTFDDNGSMKFNNGNNYYLDTNKIGEFSVLDEVLDEVIDGYVEYQLNKSNQLIYNKVSQQEAFRNKLFFIEYVNKLFSKTGKRINIKENRLAFELISNPDEKINVTSLSSGEKQLLIILLTVLCQDEKPSILLMDEPEISLDIAWQFELLSILRTLNPNCQLIIVTHSPAIYGKGWRDKVTFIEDIIPQLKKATV